MLVRVYSNDVGNYCVEHTRRYAAVTQYLLVRAIINELCYCRIVDAPTMVTRSRLLNNSTGVARHSACFPYHSMTTDNHGSNPAAVVVVIEYLAETDDTRILPAVPPATADTPPCCEQRRRPRLVDSAISQIPLRYS